MRRGSRSCAGGGAWSGGVVGSRGGWEGPPNGVAALLVVGAADAGPRGAPASLDGVWTNFSATPLERPAQFDALKNDLYQARALAPSFDFAVLEQCFQYRECARARPFLRAGKAVFDAEYALPASAFCADARRLGISAMRKRLDLGAWREPC